MELSRRMHARLQEARDRQDTFAIELWDAALKAFSAPVPSYDMESQRRQLLQNLDKKSGRYA